MRMTAETNAAQGGLEMRRRRLRFRAWHRGMREVDLLLGRFADATLDDLDETELSGFEALLLLPDPDVLSWVTGEFAVPPEADSPLVRRLLAFHGTQSNRKSDRE
jgi:antitoxin CptB